MAIHNDPDIGHDDPDVTVALEQLAFGQAGMEHVVRKYAAVTRAYEAIDATWPVNASVPDGSFGYVALSASGFLDLMFELQDVLALDPEFRSEGAHTPISLLDAGCGTGRNLHLIEASGAFERVDAHGIDIVGAYIEHGRLIYQLGDRIAQGDCMALDYSGYDVVYFYRPFADDEAQAAFEAHLIESLRQGLISWHR
jgi:SAM-dependent methyltransferase